jgi:hypothetical protein
MKMSTARSRQTVPFLSDDPDRPRMIGRVDNLLSRRRQAPRSLRRQVGDVISCRAEPNPVAHGQIERLAMHVDDQQLGPLAAGHPGGDRQQAGHA